jgi:hypothetical protein
MSVKQKETRALLGSGSVYTTLVVYLIDYEIAHGRRAFFDPGAFKLHTSRFKGVHMSIASKSSHLAVSAGLVVALLLGGTAFAQTTSPTVPSPSNPMPENPKATNGAPAAGNTAGPSGAMSGKSMGGAKMAPSGGSTSKMTAEPAPTKPGSTTK